MKRKFFTLFLSLVACLCLCFGLAACGGNDDGASKDDVEGTYYLYVDGELDLNNSITLSGGKWTSSFGMGGGTYKVSGTNITLRPDGTSATDLSSSFRGTVSDGMMKLTPPASMGGEEGVFYKQGKQPGATTTPGGNTPSTTRRTVTFHANGGLFDPDTNNESEELEVRVNNGSTVDLPDPPVRPGYEFVGWYEDSYGNHEFDFDSAIRSDRDLYAKWELGFNEHEVTYELNYEGAERVVRPTVDGRVDFTPERDGYIFNGWWRSNGNTENGSYVLTSPWDPQSRVTSDSLTLYASWIAEDDAVSRLDTPVVSEADGVFTWQPVENATLYEVGYRQYDSYSDDWNTTTVSETTWTISSGISMGTYTVRVRALGDGYHFVNSAYATVSYQHHVLSRTHIEFDQTSAILSWAAVPHADTYRLSIDGSDVQTYYAYSTSLLQYDMSNYDAGSHSVTIVAEASSYTSSTYSGTVTKLRLKTPELEFRAERDQIDYGYRVQWEAVTGADTYEIYVNGEKEETTENLYYIFYNSSVLWTADGVAEIEVYAFDSNFDHIVSIPATTGELHKLHALTLSTSDSEADLSVYGYLAPDSSIGSVTVSFDLNGYYGDPIPSQTVDSMTGLVYPEIPTRSNYIFGGWYTNSLCSGQPYDFSAPVQGSMRLYAKWVPYANAVPVTMNSNQTVFVTVRDTGSGTYYAFVPLVSGEVVIYSQVSGSFDTYCTLYDSDKYYVASDDDGNGSGQFKLVRNLTAGELYYFQPAGFSESGTLTFYIEQENATPAAGGKYGDSPVIETTYAGAKAYVPGGESVTVSVSSYHYSFDGWYNGSERVSTNYSFTFTMPDEDVDLVARWMTDHTLTVSSQTGGTVEKFTEATVSFDLNGYSGTPVPSQRVTATSGLIYPDIPTRSDYLFGGWYTDSLCSGEPFDFTAPVTEDTTLYAKWVEYNDAVPVAMNSNRTVSVVGQSSSGTYYAFVPLVTGEVVIYSQASFDTYCYLYDSAKEQIDSDDDGYGSNHQFKLTRTLTAGELYYFMPAGYNSNSGTLTFYLEQEDATPEAGGRLDQVKWYDDVAVVNSGDEVKVTAVASQGYVFDGWYANGSWVSNDLEYTYTMPNYDVELVAHWRRG